MDHLGWFKKSHHLVNIEVLFLCISLQIIVVLMLGSALRSPPFLEVKLSRTVKYRLKGPMLLTLKKN